MRDRTFDTFDEAVESAQAGDPPANPDLWVDHEVFRWEVVDDGSAVGPGPEDQDLELLGVVIGCMVGMSVAWLWMFGAFWVDDRLGLNKPAGRDSMADNVFGFFAVVGGFAVTFWLAFRVPALLARLIRPISLKAEPPTVAQYASGGPAVSDSPGAPAVPIALRVTARTRNVLFAGWLGCGVAWVVAGVVAHVVVGEAGLTAFCLATGLVLGAVGVRGFQRRLVADTAGIAIHNFLRRVRIPWGELRSVDVEPVDAVPLDSGGSRAGPHRLRFNDHFSAEVPVGLRRPGEYLFDLRATLLSMQRTYSMEGASPPYAEKSTPNPQDAQASEHAQDFQDTPSDSAASPAAAPPEAWVPPPNPDFSRPRTVLVQPRTGDVAAPRTLDTTVVKRDEWMIVFVVALVAAAFAAWSYLTEIYWLTILCVAGVLFYAWGRSVRAAFASWLMKTACEFRTSPA